jgi:hypothetical protein
VAADADQPVEPFDPIVVPAGRRVSVTAARCRLRSTLAMSGTGAAASS